MKYAELQFYLFCVGVKLGFLQLRKELFENIRISVVSIYRCKMAFYVLLQEFIYKILFKQFSILRNSSLSKGLNT